MSIEERYALEAPLEEGRFGTLYKAVDRRRAAAGDRADVTIWILPPELAKNGPALSAFRRDLERVRELDHPNISRVLDVGQDGDRLFVVSELVDGETLRNVLDALDPERLEVREADAVIESLGSALAYAHDRGIVHGDVRAENIFVTCDQRIELANFMLASSARGTPFAPALLDDSRGLATVAHELYCGSAARKGAPAQSLRALPRRRRKAIETALAIRDARAMDVTEFLALAGLKCDTRRPRRRAARAVMRSPTRFALPVAGFAALGLALYAGDDVDWSWSLPGAMSELREPREEATETTVAAPESDERDASASAVPAAASAPPVAARTAPVPRRTEPQTGSVTTAARDTTVAPTRPETPVATAETRDARASAPRAATLSAQPVTVNESQRVAKITVVRSGDLRRRLDFVWLTIEATAHAGDDFADFGARIESFAPGEAKRTLSVPLASDSVPEPSETFYVRVDVEQEAGRRAEPTTIEVRIIDDDVRATRR
jgi:hypothetical protein